MLIRASEAEARAILGAMASIAAAEGEDHTTAADRASLVAAHHYLLRQSGRLDPEEFCMPGRGTAMTEDLFASGWDFWSCVDHSVAALRQRYAIPPLEG